VRRFEESGDFSVPGVADSFDFVPRIYSKGFGDLIKNWRALLRPRGRNKDEHSAKQKTHQGETADISHRVRSSVN
jgi:hypothetical protein